MRPLVFADTISVRTDAELRARIEAAAAIEGASASDWVRRTLASVTAAPAALKAALRLAHTPHDLIPNVWPEVAPLIEAACSRPGCDHTADSLRLICERQEGLLVLVMGDDGKPAAAGVTQVRDYQSGLRSLWILALGGRRTVPWAEVIAQIEDGGRWAQCGTIEFVGRSAWRRILPGYTAEACQAGTHFLKRLGH